MTRPGFIAAAALVAMLGPSLTAASGRPQNDVRTMTDAEERRGTAAINRAEAERAAAQTRRIADDRDSARRANAQSQAEYDAEMARYRQATADTDARNAEAARAYDDRMAMYRACLRGSRRACADYRAAMYAR